MARVEIEFIGFVCPAFTDEFIWREPFERLQSAPVIVGIDEVIKVLFQLVMIVVVIPLDRCFLDRAVHAFNLAIGPWDVCVVSIDADREPGRHVVARHQVPGRHEQHKHDDVRGLEVSPGGFRQN